MSFLLLILSYRLPFSQLIYNFPFFIFHFFITLFAASNCWHSQFWSRYFLASFVWPLRPHIFWNEIVLFGVDMMHFKQHSSSILGEEIVLCIALILHLLSTQICIFVTSHIFGSILISQFSNHFSCPHWPTLFITGFYGLWCWLNHRLQQLSLYYLFLSLIT